MPDDLKRLPIVTISCDAESHKEKPMKLARFRRGVDGEWHEEQPYRRRRRAESRKWTPPPERWTSSLDGEPFDTDGFLSQFTPGPDGPVALQQLAGDQPSSQQAASGPYEQFMAPRRERFSRQCPTCDDYVPMRMEKLAPVLDWVTDNGAPSLTLTLLRRLAAILKQ